MFDFRYFLASIAGMFLMLAVGILLGVGISGRGFVDDAERGQLEGKIAALTEQVDAANAEADDLQRRQDAAADFVVGAYPVLAESRLDGKRVGVVVLGPVEQDSLPFVERAIEDDAGGRVSRMRALLLPLRLESIESALTSRPELGGYVGDEQLGNLGRDLGREFAAGGETPLWDALESEIVEERSGDFAEPVDGVVVIRTADPQESGTSRFLAGLYQGLNSTGVPVVGVEPSRVEQSAISVFQRYRLSTVDGIDTPLGQLALILLAAEADPGDYGVRDTAEDGILPPIDPLPVPSG
ncbi:MAG: copper transporter [Actinomycetota bacterium]|nr:copper transporter [Actinomycetota bacterium]